METLKLEHLAGYLPYGLKLTRNGFTGTLTSIILPREDVKRLRFTISCSQWYEDFEGTNPYKPILRPLSDMTKEIEVNGEKFIPLHKILEEYCFDLSKMDNDYILSFEDSLINVDMSYTTAQLLLSWHFDIKNLIDKDLAVNINTLNK